MKPSLPRRGRPMIDKNKIEMLVVCNDLQLLRNCDQEAFGAFYRFLEDQKDHITHFVANGDITDYEQQSRYSKSPDVYGQAIDEINATQWFFEAVARLLPHAEKVFVAGNHDQRYENMKKDQTMGVEHWLRTPSEMFRMKELGWREIGYGQGQFYRWHERIFWHGHRAGRKAHIAKIELEDSHGLSVTTAHINRNMYHEDRTVLGIQLSGITHGGFSKDNLGFVKSANSKWSQGFGVYYWNYYTGEQPYLVVMKHGTPRFVWNGKIYDGTGFSMNDEILRLLKATGRKGFL